MSWGDLAERVAHARAHPVTLAAHARTADPADRLARLVAAARLERVARTFALRIPAARAGHTQITKRPATWPLRAWQGDYLAPAQPAWLANPDPRLTFYSLISATLDDAVWHDRAYWKVTARAADGYPLRFRRVEPARVTEAADDDGGPPSLLVDGKPVGGPAPVVLADGRIIETLIRFDWAGLGGLTAYGQVIFDLAGKLLDAAARYADAPQPQTALVNEGPDLDDDEIDDLLDDWDAARLERATAYLNKAVKLEQYGWNAKELQLVEAREHAALEIARALSLPAYAVDADAGTSMTYSNVRDRRADLVEALRSWIAPIEQGLSLHAAPRGTDLRFDVTAYLRDAPQARMDVWASGIASGVLTVAEARAQEPLATGAAP